MMEEEIPLIIPNVAFYLTAQVYHLAPQKKNGFSIFGLTVESIMSLNASNQDIEVDLGIEGDILLAGL